MAGATSEATLRLITQLQLLGFEGSGYLARWVLDGLGG